MLNSLGIKEKKQKMDSYDAVAFLGGAILSVCCVPQIMHMYRTKCAADVQKRFLLLYLLGSILQWIYFVHEGAVAAWAMSILEVCT